MHDRLVILYIAMSLDGYIAGDNDDLAFLSSVEQPGEDYGYASFKQEVDTVIWGRRTYDKVQSFGADFPHPDKQVYVMSRTRSGHDGHVQYYNGPVSELITEIRRQPGKHIYCDGGGGIVAELLREDLIDRMIVSVIPYLVGSGIRLFQDRRPAQRLRLVQSTTYPSGLVQLRYEKMSPA